MHPTVTPPSTYPSCIHPTVTPPSTYPSCLYTTCVQLTCVQPTCIQPTCIQPTWVQLTCIRHTCIQHMYTTHLSTTHLHTTHVTCIQPTCNSHPYPTWIQLVYYLRPLITHQQDVVQNPPTHLGELWNTPLAVCVCHQAISPQPAAIFNLVCRPGGGGGGAAHKTNCCRLPSTLQEPLPFHAEYIFMSSTSKTFHEN